MWHLAHHGRASRLPVCSTTEQAREGQTARALHHTRAQVSAVGGARRGSEPATRENLRTTLTCSVGFHSFGSLSRSALTVSISPSVAALIH